MAKYLIGNIKGPAGFSPTARVEQTEGGAVITVVDANGTTTANIRNGIDGTGDPVDLSPYATKLEVAAVVNNIELADYASKSYVDAAVDDVEAPVQSVNGMVGNVVLSIPEELEAGDNITIENNTISATYLEEDPIFAISPAASITSEDIARWDEANSFTGDYDDLTNKPDLSIYAQTAGLATVATSGSYNDLTNKPDLTVYAETADLATVATTGDYDDLTNKPTIPVLPTLATVATTGDYDDLTDKPDLSGFATTTALTTGLAAKQDTLTAGTNITIDANNVISAAGGGSGSSDVFEYDGSAEAQSSLLTLLAAGTPPKFIEDKRTGLFGVYSYYDGPNTSGTNLYWHYVISDGTTGNGIGKRLDIRTPNDYSAITQFSVSQRNINGNLVDVSNAIQADFPSAQSKMLGQLFRSIGSDYAKKTEVPTPDGTTITSNNGVWSAVGGGGGTTYTAGTGIDITNDEISVDTSVVALKTDIPAANTYGDADVADYISDTFGMGVSGAGPTLWGQTEDPMYLNEDSQAEVILEGADASNPFVVNTGYHIEFELLANADDSVVETVNETFTATSVNSDGEGQEFNTFENSNNTISLSVDYWGDAWWLEAATFTGYVGSGWHISNFKIYLPTSGTVKTPLNADFIPNTIARVSDIPADELPDYSNASAGDVLAVDSNGGLEWTTPSGGGGSGSLPTINTTDKGKVLTVNAAGNDVEWSTMYGPGCIVNGDDAVSLAPIGDLYKVARATQNWNQVPKYFMLYSNIYRLVGYGNIWATSSTLTYACITLNPYSQDNSKNMLRVIYITLTCYNGNVSGRTKRTNEYVIPTMTDIPTTSNYAASAIYLKDTNNVKYQITVDTNGSLVATAV